MELKEVFCEEGMSQQIYCSSPQMFRHQGQILWASLVAQQEMQETWVQSLGQGDLLEKDMALCSK